MVEDAWLTVWNEVTMKLNDKQRSQIVNEVLGEVYKHREQNQKKSFWSSGIGIAIVSTFGAALITLIWNIFSYCSAKDLEQRRKDYEQKAELREAFVNAVDAQIGHLTTYCRATTVDAFEQLIRLYILKPQQTLIMQNESISDKKQLQRLASLLENSEEYEQKELKTRARAYDAYINAGRSANNYVDDIKVVFDLNYTHELAEQFYQAWEQLVDESEPKATRSYVDELKKTANHELQEIRSKNICNKVPSETNLFKIQERRKHVCREKKRKIDQIFKKLSAALSIEMRAQRGIPIRQ